MIIKASSRYEGDKVIWGEPQVFHEITDDCKFDDWHSIMACHLAKRSESYPIVTWSVGKI